MEGRRLKRAGNRPDPKKSWKSCLKEGRVLQTAGMTGQCVGNTKYINKQQLRLKHGCSQTTKGDDLSGGPVSHSTPPLRPEQLDLDRYLHTPWHHSSPSAPGHRHGPEVPPSTSDLSKNEEHLPLDVSPCVEIKGWFLFSEWGPDPRRWLREQRAAACTVSWFLSDSNGGWSDTSHLKMVFPVFQTLTKFQYLG